MAATLSHDLSDELITELFDRCPSGAAVANFAAMLAGRSDSAAVVAAGERVFGAFGTRLMESTLELGEQYTDQAYEVLKAAAKKTGRLYFPHVAQRFLEIAYLATQPIATVDVVENNHYRLTHRVGAECAIYKSVEETCGEEVAMQMPCRNACLSALTALYDALRLDVTLKQEAALAKDGQCRFVATNNRPLEATPWRRQA